MSEDEFAPHLGFEEAPANFVSPSQKARVWTELWVRNSLFCPHCGEPRFGQFANNRPAADFYCTNCREEFELKSQKGRFGAKIVDGAYRTMRERVAQQNNPNLILLNYDVAALEVTNVFVVPKHFLVQETIQKRPPLAATARRAGWVGCNILLGRIPAAGRIHMVQDRLPVAKAIVREQWQNTFFLRESSEVARRWIVEVLQIIEDIGSSDFTLADVYAREARLQAAYPANRNVRPKIRQQLQVLRDHGLLTFEGRGVYRLR